MLRLLLASMAVLAIFVGGLGVAAEKNKAKSNTKEASTANQKGQKATITKVDPKNHTITVKMKGKDGKEETRTFKLTEEVRMVDSTGRVAALDVFQAGNEVLVIEAEGRLREVRQHGNKANPQANPTKEKTQK
jgi:hypothetical protein